MKIGIQAIILEIMSYDINRACEDQTRKVRSHVKYRYTKVKKSMLSFECRPLYHRRRRIRW